MSWGYNDFLYLHNEWTIEEILDLLKQVEDLGGMDRFNKRVAEIEQKNQEIKDLSAKVEQLEIKNKTLQYTLDKTQYVLIGALHSIGCINNVLRCQMAPIDLIPGKILITQCKYSQEYSKYVVYVYIFRNDGNNVSLFEKNGELTEEGLFALEQKISIIENGYKYTINTNKSINTEVSANENLV